jgi:DNA-binding MarR family transcriptional regulator
MSEPAVVETLSSAVESSPSVVESLERIIVAGVAMTTVAISSARPGFDLTFPQWRVVVILADEPDGVRISEVSRRVGVTLPATSRQLRRLERRGLIEVAPDPRDRRAAVARLTDAGREVRDEIVAHRHTRLVDLVRDLDADADVRRALVEAADALTRR